MAIVPKVRNEYINILNISLKVEALSFFFFGEMNILNYIIFRVSKAVKNPFREFNTNIVFSKFNSILRLLIKLI
jgi:hypothetical protein